ncbi:MAG: hypothetical protein K0R38_5307 [Polyangiaceae bacterium]|nr:hypothetical protein [Polyangiaceae bacterium]
MRKKTSRQRDSLKAVDVPSAVAAGARSSARAAELAPSNAAGVMVAVELGAEFPTIALPAGACRRVVAQLEGESPATFAERVASVLESSFGRGVALSQLSLACNERLDDAAHVSRRQLASAALGAMAKHHTGKVSLCASARSSGRLRQGLATLARGLFDEWRTAGLEAGVDFGAEPAAVAATTAFLYTARVA